jgi:dephospho-CoA kinase
MLAVALTGNVASGKSIVLGHFQRWGAAVVDTDELAREVVEPGRPALAAIFARFGSELRRADGSLDRALLRRRVMGDDERRAVLNAIVHPEVMRLHAERIEVARRAGAEIVVSDIPLLFEVLDPGAWDVVVLVDAPEETRRRRLIDLRGYSEDEAREVMDAQLPSRLKRGKSHIVIDNDGSPEALEANAKGAWEALRAEAARRRNARR